ncbi:MAG: glycosyltransferase family 4 protein [Thermodesulfovibrionales bacterium]
MNPYNNALRDQNGKRIKILHVAATTTGGVGLLLLYLAKGLDKERYDTVVAFGRGYLLDEEFFSSGIKVQTIGTTRGANPVSILKGFFQVYRLIRKEKFDIVHGHTSVGGLIARIAGKLGGAKIVVWSIHGFASHEGQGRLKRNFFRLIEKFLDMFTDHYIAVSHALVLEGVEGKILKPEKVTVIHNGLDIEAYRKPFDVEAKRKEFGVDDACHIIGTITRMETQKAVHDFISAISIVIPEFPALKVLIAGSGPLEDEIKEMVARLGLEGNIKLLGWRNDAPEVIAALDIFCQSSLWEGCPMVLLEAMASEKPIIATDVGGVREIVEDKVTGILVPPADPGALAGAISHLLREKDMASDMGRSGRERVEQCFTVGLMLQRYERLYLDLLQKYAYNQIK